MPVTIDCPRCRRTIDVTHDDLRQSVENGTPPPCEWCDAQAVVATMTAAQDGGTREPQTGAEVLVRVLADAGGIMDLSPLVLAAWYREPKRFGLPGFEKRHPSSKRVECEIANMLRKAHPVVRRTAQCRYGLTAAGIELAKTLKGANQ